MSKTYNYTTGKHEKSAKKRKPAIKWWKDAMGIGNKAGEGALAKRRKKVIDSNLKKAGG